MLDPWQMVLAGVMVTLMGGPTVTVTLAVPVQPFASVDVTVYVMVEVGLAFTVAPVVVFKPVEGLQA